MSPDQIREAFEKGKALDPDTSMSDDAVYAMHEQQRILEEEETELPVPQTKPLPYRPESLPTTSMNTTRGQVILEGLTSTKDYHQNVDTPETQDKRREEQFDAVAKRKEDELVTEGAGALMEALSSAKDIYEAENLSLREHQTEEWLALQDGLQRGNLAPTDVVLISDDEEVVDDEIVPEKATEWLAIKDEVVEWTDGLQQQLTQEKFCCITIEFIPPEERDYPDHIEEALEWLMRYGQGKVEWAFTTAKPESGGRCAQYLADDGYRAHFVFADMQAATHPALSRVVNIGKIARCNADYDCGSAYGLVTDSGLKVPNLRRGQPMIITQVPACSPTMQHSRNMNTHHKARFVLVRLLWKADDDSEFYVVDRPLSLVDYSLLVPLERLEELIFREKIIWKWENREAITSLEVVSTRLMGVPVHSGDDRQAQKGKFSHVTYETVDEPEDLSDPLRMDQRKKVKGMIREERRKDLEEGKMDVDVGVEGTPDEPTTFVSPEVRTVEIPTGASIARDSDDTAWGTGSGRTDEAAIALSGLLDTIVKNNVGMNRLDLKKMERQLKMGAAQNDALSILALRVLNPILDKIPDNLQVCPECYEGVLPGVQICDRCQFILTTVHSKVEETVHVSLVALVTDATVECVDNDKSEVEEVDIQRQPTDMDGNIPRKYRTPGANPGVLNVTYLAKPGAEIYTRVNQPPPKTPGRLAEGGSFAFLRRRGENLRAIKNETQEQKEARETKKEISKILKEVAKKRESESRWTCSSIPPEG
jgi:hypothetical protein